MSGSERAHSTAHMYSCVQCGCHEVNLHDPHTEQPVHHLSFPDETANKSCIFIRWRTALPLPLPMRVCARECVGVCERTWKPRSHVPLQNKMKSNLWSFAVKSYSPHVSQWGQRGGGSHSTGVVLMQICREGKIKTIQCGKSAFSLLISTTPPSVHCRINNLVRVKLYTGSK